MQTFMPIGIELCPQENQGGKLFHEPTQEGRQAAVGHQETQKPQHLNQIQHLTARGIE